jgi:hypothetical protein
MSKKLYHEALERDLAQLTTKAMRQRALCEHTDGLEQFQLRLQVHSLEHRRQVFEERLRNLKLEPDGFWADVRADFRRIGDELASGFERWIELLDDARQDTRHRR